MVHIGRNNALTTTLRCICGLTLAASIGASSLSAQTISSTSQVPRALAATTSTLPGQADKAIQSNHVAKQLRIAIAKCWRFDAGAAPAAAAKSVQIEFVIKLSGAIAGTPRIVNRRGEPTPVALAQSALRAVQACAPYTQLPAEAFNDGTLPVRMTFDARGL